MCVVFNECVHVSAVQNLDSIWGAELVKAGSVDPDNWVKISVGVAPFDNNVWAFMDSLSALERSAAVPLGKLGGTTSKELIKVMH